MSASSFAGTPSSAPHDALPSEDGTELRSLDSTSDAASARPPVYQRLRDLVYRSPYIRPEYVISRLPAGALPEIRALMLERMGRHREALRLYCHGLKDLKLAEEYCDRVYNALVAESRAPSSRSSAASLHGYKLPLLDEPGDVYIELLLALLEGPPGQGGAEGEGGDLGGMADAAGPGRKGEAGGGAAGGPPGAEPGEEEEGRRTLAGGTLSWREVAWLLSRKVERLNCVKVLALVPGSTPLADIGPFLESTLAALHAQHRSLAVVKHLRRSENLQLHQERVEVQQRRVVLTFDRACSICHKRIGQAVLVAHPNGQLSHYLCYRRHSGGGSGPTPALLSSMSPPQGGLLSNLRLS